MKVLIVDDHPVVRIAMRQRILQEWPDADVREAPTLARSLALSQGASPDVLVLDLTVPDGNGIESAARALKALKSTRVVVVSLSVELAHASRLLEIGVAAYLPKALLGTELVPAVHRVLDGGRFVTASLADQLLGLLGEQPVRA